MDKISVLLFVILGTAVAELPAPGYPHSQPLGLNGHLGHGGHSGSDGGYTALSSGYQTSEGLDVDPAILHKIKEILLDHENLVESVSGGHSNSIHHAPSQSYGVPSATYGVPISAPSQSYGVPHKSNRVVGIELGGVRQGLQVAQFYKAQAAHAPVYLAPIRYIAPAPAPAPIPAHHYHHHAPAPVYHAPAPTYHAPVQIHHVPAPIHHAPAPIYHAPAPIYHAPAPVHHAPIHHVSVPHSVYGPPPQPRHHHVPAPVYGAPHH